MPTDLRTTAAPDVTRLRAHGVTTTAGGRTVLRDIHLEVGRGELVAIIGPSGAGKTTLLRTLAGLRRPSAGRVELDGVDVTVGSDNRVGYVPQDDIIHLDLPLRRTIAYAAELRLPATSRAERRRAVDGVLDDLDLREHEGVRIRDLSGGQRKRASIAVELLTHPDILLLDEPTSGLDPATAAEVLRVLRRLTITGASVVLTTHAPDDVLRCDRAVVVAPGGRLAYAGPSDHAAAWFGVERLGDVYRVLAAGGVAVSAPFPASGALPAGPSPARHRPQGDRGRRSPRQLVTLTRRNADLMLANRLTAIILAGAPILVIAMLATLFQPGTISAAGSPIAGVQLVYWIAFAGFFFGLTYGLLQIVTEASVVRREATWGVSMSAYVLSKLVVLLPLLVAVDAALLTVLRLTDRIPGLVSSDWLTLGGAFLADALAGLALGLLTSALVTSAAQATLALPMLCFPQVLFAGAMVPVETMTDVGRTISAAMSARWAFEAIGRVLVGTDTYVDGEAALGDWAGAFTGATGPATAGLAVLAVACLAVTVAVLRRRIRPA